MNKLWFTTTWEFYVVIGLVILYGIYGIYKIGYSMGRLDVTREISRVTYFNSLNDYNNKKPRSRL